MKKIIYFLLFIFAAVACDRNMDEINTDPDKPNVVPPRFLATGAILDMTGNSSGKGFLPESWLMKTIASNEIDQSHMYNALGSSSIAYPLLIDTKKMVQYAEADETMAEGVRNSYKALDLFTKAWEFYRTTMEMGDIPCSEALGGEEGHFRPAYDTQEAVFNTVLKMLDEASALFSKGAAFEGDPIYQGNPDAWAKNTNAFMLRILNHLAKKEKVGDISVRQKFEEVAGRAVYSDSGDDFARRYSNKAGQYYPFYRLNHNYTNNMFMQEFIVEMLKKYQDNRLFYYADPANKSIVEGKSPSDFEAYSGVDGTQQFGDVVKETNAGMHSKINSRYYKDPVCEPVRKLSYVEVQFILAEAALRGWATPNSAENHYKAAVTAAMKFTAQYTQEEFRHGVTIDDAYIANYLATTAAFTTAADQLQLLMEQKYIASFMQNNWNTYFDYRRTGLPGIPINAETSQNVDYKDRMPVRWTYPSSEYNSNHPNLEAAVKRQFGGTVETQNDIMWLLK